MSSRGASPERSLTDDAAVEEWGTDADTVPLLDVRTGAVVRVPAGLVRELELAQSPPAAAAGATSPSAVSPAAPAAAAPRSLLAGLLAPRAASAAAAAVAASEAAAPAALAVVRRRLQRGDVQAAAVPPALISVHAASRTFSLGRYPPLAFLVGSRAYIVFGALLVAAAAQVSFLFPCYVGQTGVVTTAGAAYCVEDGDVPSLPSPLAACPSSVCVSRVPVTMQTYAVLLNGALAGRTGALATLLYVALVCLGAPFGAGGRALAVWNKGALAGPSGGYFVGFVAASYIMGVCAEKAHDRPTRRVWRLVAWMLAAEAAIYLCAVLVYPLGLANATGKPVSAVCPDASPAGVGSCVSKVAQALLVPFIPGDAFKMALVVATVPPAWALAQRLHVWRAGVGVGAARGGAAASSSARGATLAAVA